MARQAPTCDWCLIVADFQTVKTEIDTIFTQFVPGTVIPEGDELPEYRRKLAASRVLILGEFEGYFEAACLELAGAGIAKFRADSNANQVVLGLVAHAAEPLTLQDKCVNQQSVSQLANTTYEKYINRVKSNNGITEKYLIKLMAPIGVNVTAFDSLWLNDLNEYGRFRGTAAHNGTAATAVNSPADEKAKLTNVVSGFEHLANEMASIFAGL
jgi:hypothetical protein